ncbi:MAG: helix-turn-helix transcriptional regulator [Burkholderiales bacterium]|nr:helix-turn-helix transcriptional regulator [Burkholderiales bacterium]
MLKPDLAQRVQKAAALCRQIGISQQQIAEALGASQSQVSRILGGRSQRHSRLVEDVCLFVERTAGGGVSAEAVKRNPDLVGAVQAVWDGSAGHAKALSTVIRSLGLLHRPEL